jgi:hypothetical protein
MPRTRHSEVATIGGNHTTGFPTIYPAAAAPQNREGPQKRSGKPLPQVCDYDLLAGLCLHSQIKS